MSDQRRTGQDNKGGRTFEKRSAPNRNFGQKRGGSAAPGRRDFRNGKNGRSGEVRPQNAPEGFNPRKIALQILQKVHNEGGYASLSLNEMLPQQGMKPEDRRLAAALVYGVLENQLKLDHVIAQLTDHPVREPAQQDLLRIGAYQILMMDRIPESAAVNESVKLVRQMGMEGAAGFINAVLRNLCRKKEELVFPVKEEDPLSWLSIETSTPKWLIERLNKAYGEEEAEKLLKFRPQSHPVVLRPNMTKLTDKQFETMMQKKGLAFEKGVAPHAYLVSGMTDVSGDPDFRSGQYSVQGQSSILAAEAVDCKPGQRILDACAAPGGKSAYLCEKMQMTGRVFAWELHEKRAMLLDSVKRRLRLDNLRITARDATEYREDLETSLDAVLLDAPCSGTGVLVEKPDIKHRLKDEDIAALAATQQKLLETVSRYVKPGGVLVYSTCSILPEENRMQVERFLQNNPSFHLEPLPLTIPEELRKKQGEYGLQLLPHRDGVEGFFIARMRRVR